PRRTGGNGGKSVAAVRRPGSAARATSDCNVGRSGSEDSCRRDARRASRLLLPLGGCWGYGNPPLALVEQGGEQEQHSVRASPLFGVVAVALGNLVLRLAPRRSQLGDGGAEF